MRMNTAHEKKIPSQLEVTHYFFRMGLQVKHANAFYLFYQHENWLLSQGKPVKNWKAVAFKWVCSFEKATPIRKQPIYS